jgi:hypothetical protein
MSAIASCPPPIKSSPYVSGPKIFFLHFRNQPHIGGFAYDILFQLPFPCSKFALVSMTALTNSLFLHLTPTNLPNPGSGAPVISGNEEWFAMTTTPYAGGPVYWANVKFAQPVSKIYLSAGTESGAGSNLTLMCVADEGADVSGGVWT